MAFHVESKGDALLTCGAPAITDSDHKVQENDSSKLTADVSVGRNLTSAADNNNNGNNTISDLSIAKEEPMVSPETALAICLPHKTAPASVDGPADGTHHLEDANHNSPEQVHSEIRRNSPAPASVDDITVESCIDDATKQPTHDVTGATAPAIIMDPSLLDVRVETDSEQRDEKSSKHVGLNLSNDIRSRTQLMNGPLGNDSVSSDSSCTAIGEMRLDTKIRADPVESEKADDDENVVVEVNEGRVESTGDQAINHIQALASGTDAVQRGCSAPTSMGHNLNFKAAVQKISTLNGRCIPNDGPSNDDEQNRIPNSDNSGTGPMESANDDVDKIGQTEKVVNGRESLASSANDDTISHNNEHPGSGYSANGGQVNKRYPEEKVIDGNESLASSAEDFTTDTLSDNNDRLDTVNAETGATEVANNDETDKSWGEAEAPGGKHENESSVSSVEGTAIDVSDAQNADPDVGKKSFFFLVRVPKCDDENLREQIRMTQIAVDEKTGRREVVRAEVQTKRANCRSYYDDFAATLSEETAARELLRSKRQDIEYLQSEIDLKDIDGRIWDMEHMIQHETLPLKEEKQLIHEIKQLRQTREQLFPSAGKEDGVRQRPDQKYQMGERLKSLKKEANLLRDSLLKAEALTKAARLKYDEESKILAALQSQFKEADEIRQKAYANLQKLRNQVYEKNKWFRQYRDDLSVARDLAVSGDREALQSLCNDQVEKFVEEWNKNDEYRKEYIRSNVRSTLRRLRTMDGRSLAPNEKPPVIPGVTNQGVREANGEDEKRDNELAAEVERPSDKPLQQRSEAAKNKQHTESTTPRNGLVAAFEWEQTELGTEIEQKMTNEEEQLARKAEELKEEEEAARLKEQRQLEEIAKAKEALERKKRNAEKAQARAALRAKKEAEQKEKEREKRTQKKERRKAATAAAEGDVKVGKDVDSAAASKTLADTRDSETRDKPEAMVKRHQKTSQASKQAKAKSISLLLRNRGKRRTRPWMWVALVAVILFTLFWIGNRSFYDDLGLQGFNF